MEIYFIAVTAWYVGDNVTVLKTARTRPKEGGGSHFPGSDRQLGLQASSRLAPSVETHRAVIISAHVTEVRMFCGVKCCVLTHLSQTLGNQG